MITSLIAKWFNRPKQIKYDPFPWMSEHDRRKDEIIRRLEEIDRMKPYVGPAEKIAMAKEKRALDVEIGHLFDLDDEILKNL